MTSIPERSAPLHRQMVQVFVFRPADMRTCVRMRWESQNISSDDAGRLPGMGETVVRRFDAPEALNIRFHEVRTKSALNHVPPGTSRVPFEWTINPYRGCTHACVYCFARPTHEYLELDAGRDFEREIIVKVNVPEVLRKELARPSWRGASIALGTNTDPYQWVEGRYKLMRGIWEVMRDFRNPCSILTKSPLLLRDLDLLQEIAAVTDVSACLSVPTLDEKAWRATEPHTPNPKARLEAVAELNRAGIPTGVLIAPLMPGVNDAPEQVERIVDAATEAQRDLHRRPDPVPARRGPRHLLRLAARAPPGPDPALRAPLRQGRLRLPGRQAQDRARRRRPLGAARPTRPRPPPAGQRRALGAPHALRGGEASRRRAGAVAAGVATQRGAVQRRSTCLTAVRTAAPTRWVVTSRPSHRDPETRSVWASVGCWGAAITSTPRRAPCALPDAPDRPARPPREVGAGRADPALRPHRWPPTSNASGSSAWTRPCASPPRS